MLSSSLASRFRGLMADEGQLHQFDDSMVIQAINFAQLELAKKTRLTMHSRQLYASSRLVEIPADCIDLSRVVAGSSGSGTSE